MTKSLIVMAVLSASLALSSTVNAQAFTPEQLTSQVKKLNAQSNATVDRLNQVGRELGSAKQQLGKVERLVDNRAMIELMQRVDTLSDEVSQLRGEMEQQGFDLSGLKKRQRELYLDTDRRLRDLESRSTQQSSNTPVQVPGLAQVTTPSVDLATQGGATPAVEPVTPQPEVALPTVTQSAASVTSSEEQAAYQAAFDTLKEGRYKKAKSELRAFLKNHPNSSFAGNSQYWLGEAHYVTREFKQGIEEFNTVLSKYPGSSKIPDAMLKLGYTYYELKQYDQAKLTLQNLQTRYPKSTAFRLAGKRLDRIRKEGH